MGEQHPASANNVDRSEQTTSAASAHGPPHPRAATHNPIAVYTDTFTYTFLLSSIMKHSTHNNNKKYQTQIPNWPFNFKLTEACIMVTKQLTYYTLVDI